MSENKQTALAAAVLLAFAVLFGAGLWYEDHRPPAYREWDGTPRPARVVTGGIVRWDTALTDVIAAPARAPYAQCTVYRGDRVIVTETYTIDGTWHHYLALTEAGCIGWITDEALSEY